MNDSNIINVNFHNDVFRASVTQWDKGQTLYFEDNFPDGTEVQFLNGTTMLIENHMCGIPDILLQSKSEIRAWIQLIGEDNETTIKEIHINITPRAKKNDYIDPEDAPTFREQMQTIMLNTKTIADSVREDADNGAFDGADGADGVSPSVEVEEITGGHKVTITDANGEQSFDVMDGNSDDLTASDIPVEQESEDDPANVQDKLNELQTSKQDKLTAGTGVTIDGNRISASDMIVDIYYNGELFTHIVPFKDIIKAIHNNQNVFVRWNNGGGTFILPLKSVSNKSVHFYGLFGDTIICRIDRNEGVLLCSRRQYNEWKETGGNFVPDPIGLYCDIMGYNDENSFRINLTTNHTVIGNDPFVEGATMIDVSYSSDKTFEEIHDAWGEGKTVWCVLDDYSVFNLFSYSPADGDYPAVFVFSKSICSSSVAGFRITSDDVELISVQVYELEEYNE